MSEATLTAPADEAYPAGTELTYGEFGRQLFWTILHEERIEASVAAVLGETIDLEFGAGPGKLATVRAVGTIGRPRATRVEGDFVAFDVILPVQVVFDLDIAVDLHRFHAEVAVPLRLEARASAPLAIVFAISPPASAEALSVQIEVDKRRTAMLRKVAGIDAELRRFMLRYVERELEKEHVVRATRLHLGDIIDEAWPMITERFLRTPTGVPDTGEWA